MGWVTRTIRCALIARFVLVFALVVGQNCLAATTYVVQDLGSVYGFESVAYAINSSGEVAGYYREYYRPQLSVRWTADGTPLVLTERESSASSEGFGINDNGQVAGEITDEQGWCPVIWNRDGSIVRLSGSGDARDINNNGLAVGYVVSDGNSSATVWDTTSGNTTDISQWLSLPDSYAMSVSNTGWVAGYAFDGSRNGLDWAFLWSQEAGMRYLTGQYENNSQAYGVNDSGQVAGFFGGYGGGTHTPVRWEADGSHLDLSLLPGFYNAEAHSINNFGACVGYAFNWGGWMETRAVVWDANGAVSELPNLQDWGYSRAWAINDSGQIAGLSSYNGDWHAVIWQPVPEPSGLVALCCSITCAIASVSGLRKCRL